MIVVVIGSIRCPLGELASYLPHLHAYVSATRELDGCLSYDVSEDLFDRGLIRFIETWPDQASLDRHLQAPHVPIYRQAARIAGTSQRCFTAYDATDPRPT